MSTKLWHMRMLFYHCWTRILYPLGVVRAVRRDQRWQRFNLDLEPNKPGSRWSSRSQREDITWSTKLGFTGSRYSRQQPSPRDCWNQINKNIEDIRGVKQLGKVYKERRSREGGNSFMITYTHIYLDLKLSALNTSISLIPLFLF